MIDNPTHTLKAYKIPTVKVPTATKKPFLMHTSIKIIKNGIITKKNPIALFT
jgi:hypothetical protein